MNARDVTRRLAALEPLELDAIALLIELEARDEITSETIDELQPRIQEATAALGDHIDAVREVVKRCQKLQPIPSRRIPPCF
jgi:uncharacterized coiled-coil protein SlyX